MTDFELIIENVKPIFEASDFNVSEFTMNYIRLESSKVTVTITHDERENSNLLFIGQTNKDSHLLHSKNLREVFNYDKSPDNFKDFLINFLQNEGKEILTGELDKLIALDNYERNQARIYTDNILIRQSINVADNAWRKNDYLSFVKVIDQIGKDNLPSSYKIKYKMASDRIEDTK